MSLGIALILDDDNNDRATLVNCLHTWQWPVLAATSPLTIAHYLSDQRIRLCIINTDLFSDPFCDLSLILNTLSTCQFMILAGELWSAHRPTLGRPVQVCQLPYPVPERALNAVISSLVAMARVAQGRDGNPGNLFDIDTRRRLLRLRDRYVRLSNDEIQIVKYLNDACGRVCGYRELAHLLYPNSNYSEEEARHLLRGRMYYLQSKIECDPRSPEYLVCVRGTGYQLLVPGRVDHYAFWLETSSDWSIEKIAWPDDWPFSILYL
ncbi:MAG: helix-turn-helix domain-containing protein [Chloroflexus sp.]